MDDVDVVQPTVSSLLSHLHTQGLFASMSPSELLIAVGLASPPLTEDESQTVLTQESLIERLKKGDGSKEDSKKAYRDYVLSSSLVAREIGLRPGQQALVVNGRVSFFVGGGMKYMCSDVSPLRSLDLSPRVICSLMI